MPAPIFLTPYCSATPTTWKRNVLNFHAIIQIPKDDRHPHPPVQQTAGAGKFRQERARTKNHDHVPHLSPGRLALHSAARDAAGGGGITGARRCARLFSDPAFLKEFKRLSADDATPLLPEAQEKAIKDIPRDADVIALFNKIAGNDPLPPR